MSDTSQAQPPANNGAPVDDGFDTAEERAAFEQMAIPDPADGGAAAPAEVPDPAAVAAAAAAAGVAAPVVDDDDEEDDDGAAAAAAGGAAAPADGVKPPKRRVSANKYARSEAARIAAENRVKEVETNQARLDERLRILNEALIPPAAKAKTPAEEDPEPDAEADVFSWIKWNKRNTDRLQQEIVDLRTGREAEVEDNTLANNYTSDARSFAAVEPNFVPAYQFLMANRTLELAEYYFGKDLTVDGTRLTDEEIARIRTTIGNEEKLLAKEAIAAKQSPAKRIFALARARGFRPAPPPTADEATAAAAAAAANGAGEPAAGAAAPAAKPAAGGAPGSLAEAPAAGGVTEEIERIRAGSEASRTLSSGGGAPPNPLTPDKLANMSDEDFARVVESLSPAQEQALFGSN